MCCENTHYYLASQLACSDLLRATILINDYPCATSAANAINSQLAKVFGSASSYDCNIIDDNWCPTTTAYDIWHMLKSTPVGKAYGSDQVATALYKHAAPFIAAPLAHVINLSLQQHTVPASWKLAHVVAVPKCTMPSISDLRPISLIPLPAKLLEKVVYSSLKRQLIDNFGSNQFGFRPGSSTTAALVSVHDTITRLLDLPDVNGVQLTSYDYSKAFDTLNHDIIINRVIDDNFPSGFVLWLLNYLRNRVQQVRIGDSLSHRLAITSGVPQGSIIGPALFNVVINDLTFESLPMSQSTLTKYADDTTSISPLFKNKNNVHVLVEYKHITKWSEYNHLTINEKKVSQSSLPLHRQFPVSNYQESQLSTT